jgi:hypothetical protein
MEPKKINVELPYGFKPRLYQQRVFEELDNGTKRMLLIWHRRAGKDLTVWNAMIRAACERVGVYYYIFPTYAQGKKVLWEGIDGAGRSFLDYIPKELVAETSNSEMRLTLYNGSIIRVIGVENVDSIVGTNPCFCAFSEYSILRDSNTWDLLRPILAQNDGIAIFMFTPRGRNHAWQLMKSIERSPDWFVNLLTVDDTHAVTLEQIEREKKEMLSYELFRQEYYCEFMDSDIQVFKNIDQYVTSKDLICDKRKKYVLGVDLGQKIDYTVIFPIDRSNFHVGQPMVMRQADFLLQSTMIELQYRKWNNATVTVDATGLGAPVCDYLAKNIRDLRRFNFTQKSKPDLLQNLLIRLAKGDLKLPNCPELLDQLKAFQYKQSGSRLSMEVPSGMHDDHVMALALAVWELPENPAPMRDARRMDDLRQFEANRGKKRLRSWMPPM